MSVNYLLDGKIRPIRNIPSMSDAMPVLLESVPVLARSKSGPNIFLICNFFLATKLYKSQCFTTIYVVLAQWLERCNLQWRDHTFNPKWCAIGLAAYARQSILNLRKRIGAFYLLKAKFFLLLGSASKSFFTRTIQLFTTSNARPSELGFRTDRSLARLVTTMLWSSTIHLDRY